MARVRSMQYDDQDDFWDSRKEQRKNRSTQDNCKQKKTSSIRRGIEDYWDKRSLRQNIADSYEEDDDLDETYSDLDDQNYH